MRGIVNASRTETIIAGNFRVLLRPPLESGFVERLFACGKTCRRRPDAPPSQLIASIDLKARCLHNTGIENAGCTL